MKDFRVRYRNMSLGFFWSLLNPLIMMSVLWFVFTRLMQNRIPNFPVFVMCGLVPFNVFTVSWLCGTTSLIDNAHLIKRINAPREVFPIAGVLSSCAHLSTQLLLLLAITLISGLGINAHWPWLIAVWAFEILFVAGLSLVTAALNVYVKDVRYVVESANLVLFWLVPIFYDFSSIPAQYRDVYQYNPVAALVLAMRTILLDGSSPRPVLMERLAVSSIVSFGLGLFVFRKLKNRLYNYL